MSIDPQSVAITLGVISGVGSGLTATLTRRVAGPGVPSVRGALAHTMLACMGLVGATIAYLFHFDFATVVATLAATGNAGMALLVAPSADPSQTRVPAQATEPSQTEEASPR